ncbi:hypothetical protein CGRA01v4_13069 [Colletotrichum graminicola]|nr:hypothetical protein CGRA01v4_13069 [Colletotrichum graminicola]
MPFGGQLLHQEWARQATRTRFPKRGIGCAVAGTPEAYIHSHTAQSLTHTVTHTQIHSLSRASDDVSFVSVDQYPERKKTQHPPPSSPSPSTPLPLSVNKVRKRYRPRSSGTASHQGSTDTHLARPRLTKSPLRRWQHAGPTIWDAGASRSRSRRSGCRSNEMSVGYHHKVTGTSTLTLNRPLHCVLVPREADRHVQPSCAALAWAGSRQSRRRT